MLLQNQKTNYILWSLSMSSVTPRRQDIPSHYFHTMTPSWLDSENTENIGNMNVMSWLYEQVCQIDFYNKTEITWKYRHWVRRSRSTFLFDPVHCIAFLFAPLNKVIKQATHVSTIGHND